MSQNPNDPWGQQPAQWQQQPAPWGQQPSDGQQVQPAAAAASAARNDLVKSLAIGVGLIVFTLVMMIFFDRLFYVLPIFGVVIIIQGLVKFLKARKNPAQDGQAWNAQQQGDYPSQPVEQPYPPQQNHQPHQQAPSAGQPWQPHQQAPSAGQPWQHPNQQAQNQQPQQPPQWS